MPDSARILVADDEENIRLILRESLRREGLDVIEAANGEEALEAVRRESLDVVILDVKMPKLDGMVALERIREMDPSLPVVMITAHGGRKIALEAIRLGAYDYFEKPFEMMELRIVVKRALERRILQRHIEALEAQLEPSRGFAKIIGQSPAMQEVFHLVRRVMVTDATVLITGESGTGKELIADALHGGSNRATQPILKVNCAAIPEPLLESELFGHERGAFTGAVNTKPGKFELANKGTIFLDEIGEMPMSLQAKLLRVLQERKIDRVGGIKAIPVDVRILTATNRDLALEVAEKRFREDLYFRLNVIPIHLPPLRQRREDIPLLLSALVKKYNERMGKSVLGFTPQAMDLLQSYEWPGNVREMENIIQRSMILSPAPWMGPETLPPQMRGEKKPGAKTHGANEVFSAEFDFAKSMAVQVERMSDQFELRMIQTALEKCSGHRQETADLLGISRKSLHNKMVKLGLFDQET